MKPVYNNHKKEQVVLIQRCISIIEEAKCTSLHSGLCRQMVLIQRCSSITEEANVPVYSGLCRQVVLL